MGNGPSASGEMFWVQTDGNTTKVMNTSSGDLLLRTSRFIDDEFERDLSVDYLVKGSSPVEGEAYKDVVDDQKNASKTISYKFEARKSDNHAIRETITVKYKADERYWKIRAPEMKCEKGASGAPDDKLPKSGFHASLFVDLHLKTLIEEKGGSKGSREHKMMIVTGYITGNTISEEMKAKLNSIPIPEIEGVDMEILRNLSAEIRSEWHESQTTKTLTWTVNFDKPCYIYQASLHVPNYGEGEEYAAIRALEYIIQSPTPLPAFITWGHT